MTSVAAEVARWGPAFAHLFGVDEDAIMAWPVDRFERHRVYAEAVLNQGGGE